MRTDTQGRTKQARRVARLHWVMGLSMAMALALAACSARGANTGANTGAATGAATIAPATPAIEATISATEAATDTPTDVAEPTAAEATIPATPVTPATTATPVEATPNADLKPALQPFVDGLEKPTYLTHAGTGDGLLYVTEQVGRVRIIQNGALVETPFLDITDRVGSSGNEQGLLSVAFPPDFAQSRKFYVNYTDKSGDTHVAGFVAGADGLTADPASEWLVIKIDQPYANHNGGQLKFGPDGMLYIGMGDGGSQGDPENRAQNLNELLGKILRLDVSQSTADAPYTAPAGNAPGGKPEVWAFGFRNPWRFSFDRTTGDLFIGDVGQNNIEEVDFQAANATGGFNYGWRIREGRNDYADGEAANLIDPVWQYSHGEDGCSVTGGYMYRGPTLGALTGAYVYGDYCSGRIWALRPSADGQWTNDLLFESGYSITSFGEDAQGELYVLNRDGAIYKIAGE